MSFNSDSSHSHISQQVLPKGDAALEEDEADLNDAQPSFLTGLFGVIYTVSRERTVTWKFVAFKVLLDAWQLLALTVNPNYGWAIDGSSKAWYVLSFIQMQTFLKERGLTFFLVVLYIFEVLLLAVVAVCLWVAWSFRNKRFDSVWPITFLRWFGVIFFQMLDVASMNLILTTMDTSYFGVDASMLFIHKEFGMYTFSMPYAIHVCVSAICLIVFTVLSTLFSMGELELNMISRNYLAQAHTRVEVASFLLKFVMTCASVFLQNDDNKWLSLVYLVCAWLLVYLTVKWVPCYHSWMNYIRAGTYGAVFYSALLLVFLVFQPGVDSDDPGAVHQYQKQMTVALLAGMLPAAGLFVLAAYLRTRHYTYTVANKFRNAAPGTKLNKIHVFSDPLEVEIAARCCRKWADVDLLDEQAVELAGRVLDAGRQQLSGHPYMYILYSSYYIDVQGSFQTGLSELKAAKKADPCFLELFAIFSREQQLTQKAAGGTKGGKGEDLVSYVEQQHDYRRALKLHREALLATSAFWRTLMHPEVKLQALTKAVSDFDVAVKNADTMYREVLQRHPEDWHLLRMFAKFVETIKNDPWGASKWNAEADRLWEEEEDDRHNLFNLNFISAKDERMSQLVARTVEDTSKAVIIINAQGIMGSVNKAAGDLFGYDVRGMRGQNVSMLLPSPYAEQHDGWVRNYTSSERSSRPLERTAKWVALHRDRHVFGVKLWIAKISGTGMDCMFIGTIEPLPTPPNSAYAWVLGSGLLVSTDNVFCDWFGHRPEELAGMDMSSLVVEEHLLQEALNPGLAVDAAKYHGASEKCSTAPGPELEEVRVERMHIKHKYAGPIECSVTVTFGGVGQHHLFILNVQRCKQAEAPMVVTDSKGKVLHASSDINTVLGYSAAQIAGVEESGKMVWDLLLPQPFAQLHRTYLNQDLLKKPMPGAYSCRSGLSVCIMAATNQGPQPRPVKLRVQPKRREEGDVCNIVTFEKSSMSQALDERRLSLLVNERGVIYQAGNSPASLFGFDPQHLVGRPIASLVDVFNPEPEALHLADGSSPAALAYTQDVLVELTKQSLDSPGISFTVGVAGPVGFGVQAQDHGPAAADGKARPGAGKMSALLETVTAHMHHKGLRAAVMQVQLHVPGADDDAGLSSSAVADPGAAEGPKKVNFFTGSVSDTDMHLKVGQVSGSFEDQAVKVCVLGASSKALLILEDYNEPEPPGLQIEIFLWRADLVTGVLELNPSGQVVGSSDLELYQAGLVLGLPTESLVGAHIGELIPQAAGCNTAKLYLPHLGAGQAGRSAGKRGGLKQQSDKKDRQPGAINCLRTKHLVDEQQLELGLQATYSWTHSKNTLLVLHMLKPSLGMPGFRDWLRANPGVGKRQPRHLAQQGWGRAVPQLAAAPITGRQERSHSVAAAPAGGVLPGPDRLAGLLEQLVGGADGDGDGSRGGATRRATAAAAATLLLDAEGEGGAMPRVATWVATGSCTGSPRPSAPKVATPAPVNRLQSTEWPGKEGGGGEAAGKVPARVSPGEAPSSSSSDDEGEAKEQHGAKVVNRGQGVEVQTLMMTDVIRTPGGNRPSSEDEDAASTAVSSEDQVVAIRGERGGDYRRGQRFKRIGRLLMGETTGRNIRAFKYKAWGSAAAACCITLACFLTMYMLLHQQMQGVTTLNVMGLAATRITNIYLTMTDLNILFLNQGVAGLPGLQDARDLPALLAVLEKDTQLFMSSVTASYFKVMATPNASAMHTRWNTPSMNVTQVYDAPGGGGGFVTNTSLLSLWEASNMYSTMAINIVHNAYVRNASAFTSYASGAQWRDWKDCQFVTLNVVAILSGILSTLDDQVEVVISGTNNMNSVQHIFSAVEGAVCSVLLLAFMAASATKLNLQRWSMYNVFTVLPVGLLKGLANKTVALDDTSGDQAAAQTSGEQDDDGGAGSSTKFIFARASSLGVTNVSVLSRMWGAVCAALTFWRCSSKVGDTSTGSSRAGGAASRRKLVRSHRTAALMSVPFLLWGVMMISINSAGHSKLASVSGPIALFNLVNFVMARFFRNFSLTQDMISTLNPVVKAAKRANTLTLFVVPIEYQAMVFGGSAVPEQTSPHFTLATTGVAFAGTEGSDLLYTTRDCLRVNLSTCLPPSSTLYPYVSNGLGVTVQRYFYTIRNVLNMNGTQPMLNSSEFEYMWNVRPDIEGGLARLNDIYANFVDSVYSGCLTIHIIGLVLTLLLMSAFVLFVVRPFITEVTNETRRIAELLNQLPVDVDVEGMVRRTLPGHGPPQPATAKAPSGLPT